MRDFNPYINLDGGGTACSYTKTPEKTYIFHWPDGHEAIGKGKDSQDALGNAGYSLSELLKIDYYYEDRSDCYET